MNKNFTEISDYFKTVKLRNDRRVIVFIVCVSISTVLWFLNALGKNYTTSVSYPVKFINPPKNQFIANKTPQKIELEVNGQGFTLLRFKMLSFSPITLDIKEITQNIEPVSGSYKVYTRNLAEEISGQIGNDLKITGIRPESIEFALDSLISKTVPVELDVTIDFATPYNLKNKVTTNPAKVKITGPALTLEKINSVKTKVNIINKLETGLKQEIELLHPDNTTISPEKVMLIIEVEKYTEKEFKIPVEVRNKPERSRIKLFPSEIKVVFNVGLSRFEKIKPSDFGASVDFSSVDRNVNSLNIDLHKRPEFVQGVRFSPEKVEFLIETY